MARLMKPVLGTVAGGNAVHMKLNDADHGEGAVARGGLLQNTHGSETAYVGGSGQSTVSSVDGYPVAAGDSIFIGGVDEQTFIDTSNGFFVGGANGLTVILLPEG